MELKKGNMIKLTLDNSYMDNCDDEVLWLDYKNITQVVEIGSKIYIDDGLMSLQVKEIGGYAVVIQDNLVSWKSIIYGYNHGGP